MNDPENQLIREATGQTRDFELSCEETLEAEDRDVSNETGDQQGAKQLTCERCGNKTDGGAWLGFVYVGAECLTKADQEYIE